MLNVLIITLTRLCEIHAYKHINDVYLSPSPFVYTALPSLFSDVTFDYLRCKSVCISSAKITISARKKVEIIFVIQNHINVSFQASKSFHQQ